MGLEAGNPVVGGTVLRRAAIQSPDFVHDVQGWSINQDGTAEFQQVTVLGTIESDGSFAFSALVDGNINIGVIGAGGTPSSLFTTSSIDNGNLEIESGLATTLDGHQAAISLEDNNGGTRDPQVRISLDGAPRITSALLEVQGQIQSTNLSNIVANGDLIAQLGDIIAQAGNLIANSTGKGLQIKEGTNARSGISTLAAGTVTIPNTSITASTRVFVTPQSFGPNSGFLSISKNVGVSFTIHSSNVSDGNSVAWFLVEGI